MATLDKPAAAQRMIVCAMAMSDRGDDPLAIHVVAASALNLLRELIDRSGDPYIARVLKEGVFTAAKHIMAGEPTNLPESKELDAFIANVIGGIEAGNVQQSSDLIINGTAAEWRGMLAYIVRPFNFLKHADRDPLATLDEGDLDPDGAIMHALTAYSMIRPDFEWPEQAASFLAKHGLLGSS
jgi:hypothetical protein